MDKTSQLSLGERLKFGLIAQLGARLLRLILSTCRVEVVENPELGRQLFAGDIRVIGATWHRAAIFFLYYFGPLKPAIMISRSKDGELLARYLRVMGGQPVRGSSSKGGREALNEMAQMLTSGQATNAATVADGPRGPRYVAKAGMILLAARTGLPLLPLMCSADRAWVFGRSWDRTMIPKPFSRVKVAYGPLMRFPAGIAGQELEQARLALEQEINRLRLMVDQQCDHRDPE